MNKISSLHNTSDSEMEMCGFDCVLEMGQLSFVVFDHSGASPAQNVHWFGFWTVDGGVLTSLPPVLLSAFVVI